METNEVSQISDNTSGGLCPNDTSQTNPCQLRQVSNRRLPPFPGNGHTTPRKNSFTSVALKEPSLDAVKNYLSSHTDFLDNYIVNHASLEKLESWIRKKKSGGEKKCPERKKVGPLSPCQPPTEQEKYGSLDISAVQTHIKTSINKLGVEQLYPIYEFANSVGLAVKCDGLALYTVKSSRNELYLYVPPTGDSESHLHLVGPAGSGTTVAAHVANTKKTVLVEDLMEDDRFPKGIGVESNLVQSVLCLPFMLTENEALCVLQFSRNWDKEAFSQVDLQIVSGFIAWAGTAVCMHQLNDILRKQTRLNKYLLEVSKMIFDDIVDIDLLVKKIMTYTKDLVTADRCALFLTDDNKKELYANMFDDGQVKDGMPVFSKREIRFSMERGIAGYVARTGEVINIPDAYADSRFNRDIDKQTGYTTKNILCMPIISKGSVLGVVQMVNKLNGDCFSDTDESAFKMFSVYCALSLHYSKLYRESELKTAQHQVAMEVISYHSVCGNEEVDKFCNRPYPRVIPPDLDSLYYYGPTSNEHELSQLFIVLCDNLFGPNSFDMRKLCRFILTVKKNYRPVAYHNWHHGWNVAHCMYSVLTHIREMGIISKLRMKALLVGSLCHDLDHRGFNNAWFKKFDEPMATLYRTSVMEQHHYNMTVRILQEDDHNIFSSLNAEDYKSVLDYMRHAIIATDLTLYFGTQKSLAKLVATNSLDLNNSEHLNSAVSLIITSCDLSGCCKLWGDAYKIALTVMEEFYQQGDKEKSRGEQPIAMMDRDNASKLPQDQIGFIKFVCFPCYQTLADIFPQLGELLEGCKNNHDQWVRVMEGRSTGLWEPEKSVAN